jgi:hypothetical protein
MGTSTQMSQMVNFKIRINHFSTHDHKALIDAFERSEQHGLVDALDHIKGTGRFSTLYGVGNDIKYIIQLPQTKEAGTSNSSSIVEFPSVRSTPPRVPRSTASVLSIYFLRSTGKAPREWRCQHANSGQEDATDRHRNVSESLEPD